MYDWQYTVMGKKDQPVILRFYVANNSRFFIFIPQRAYVKMSFVANLIDHHACLAFFCDDDDDCDANFFAKRP